MSGKNCYVRLESFCSREERFMIIFQSFLILSSVNGSLSDFDKIADRNVKCGFMVANFWKNYEFNSSF